MTATKDVFRAAIWWLDEAVAADRARREEHLLTLYARGAAFGTATAHRVGESPQVDTRRDRLLGAKNFIVGYVFVYVCVSFFFVSYSRCSVSWERARTMTV